MLTLKESYRVAAARSLTKETLWMMLLEMEHGTAPPPSWNPSPTVIIMHSTVTP